MSTGGSANSQASGVVYVHSSPSAVCPHVEWAISGTLGIRVSLQWTAQPAAPGQLRAECAWTAAAGTAGKLVSALRAWPMLRFEITEDPSPGIDGVRYCFAPGLGLWHASTGANGDIMVCEGQLRTLATATESAESFRHHVEKLLGQPWDDALEPFRRAGDGAPVTWLHQVG